MTFVEWLGFLFIGHFYVLLPILAVYVTVMTMEKREKGVRYPDGET